MTNENDKNTNLFDKWIQAGKIAILETVGIANENQPLFKSHHRLVISVLQKIKEEFRKELQNRIEELKEKANKNLEKLEEANKTKKFKSIDGRNLLVNVQFYAKIEELERLKRSLE